MGTFLKAASPFSAPGLAGWRLLRWVLMSAVDQCTNPLRGRVAWGEVA